jgi:hypothetical protein
MIVYVVAATNFDCYVLLSRRRHQKSYRVVAITLRNVFTLSLNASTLRRKVIASYSYRSGLIEIVIASYSYRSDLIGIVNALGLWKSFLLPIVIALDS